MKVYGSGDTAVRALDGVTVEFPVSRYTGIMGPSGSGKSTLMHCVAGLDDLTPGVMVTHDSAAAAFSDNVLFLAEGRIVDEMAEPSAERVLDRTKRFGD